MKQYRYLVSLLFTGISLTACQESENGYHNSETEMTFSPAIQEATTSRAVGNDFFVEGNMIDIKIVTQKDAGTTEEDTYSYRYDSDGVFRGIPEGYRFPLDDQYIAKLTAKWPTDEWKAENTKNQEVLTDQRESEDFRSSDWLEATATIEGLMPTHTPVPITFEHKNCIMEFQLAGQTVNDLEIHSLVLELIIGGEPTAFWAYCGNDNGFAELILAPDIEINVTNSNSMIGRAQVKDSNGSLASYGVILPAGTYLKLEAGHKYIVTLTARGYDLTATIGIGGWGQIESGIGVPFQQPVPNDKGEYLINNAAQLISASYLIRHYNDNTTIQWHEKTYILTTNFRFTKEYLEHWIPIPGEQAGSKLFTGKFVYEGEEETEINSIPYTVNEVEFSLNLFEEDDNL